MMIFERQVFLRAEGEIWMVMAVRNPRTTARDGDKYHEDDLLDEPLHTVLKNAYSIFCLFNGLAPNLFFKRPKFTSRLLVHSNLNVQFTPTHLPPHQHACRSARESPCAFRERPHMRRHTASGAAL